MTNALMLFGLALAYALIKVFLEKRLSPLDDVGDERHLADLAFAIGCSVFDLFRSAGDRWNFSDQKVNADFQNYLRTDRIPPYVRQFLHHHPLNRNRTYQRLVYNGGRPPYL
ncbi:MAG: hypothetical protein KQI78_15805 [Deltaproteobacteria bacterium]|jgi:hypothetical protein|nr:hypothetical protein [Deltaproteobacteria bacterium]